MNLQVQEVSPELLAVLRRLMSLPQLESFYLAGGTALALHYGHRVSVDIDLFSELPFDATKLSESLSKECALSEVALDANTILGQIDGIKMDILAHQYPPIADVVVEDGLRLLAVEDIAAMKLNAIANRGSKKDFWDLYELMQHFSRQDLLGFFEKKYPSSNRWAVEKSLVYFDDAEADPNPLCLNARTWAQIKSEIQAWNRL
jgi:predicted nucleotidyltransferase component of viral defense system